MSDDRIIMVTHNLWQPLIGYMTASELKDGGMLENIGLARVGEPRQKKSPTERCPVVLHLFPEIKQEENRSFIWRNKMGDKVSFLEIMFDLQILA